MSGKGKAGATGFLEKMDSIVSNAALMSLVAGIAGVVAGRHAGCVFTSALMEVRRAVRQPIQSSRGDAPGIL